MKKALKLRRLWILAVIPAAFLLLFAAKQNTDFAQWYALNIYPWISKPINAVSSLLPFSLMEFGIIALVFICLILIIRFIVKMIKGREQRGYTAAKAVINILCAAAVIFGLFSVECGTNYYRYTFAQSAGLTIQKSTDEKLFSLCNYLAIKLNEERALVAEDENGVMKSSFRGTDDMGKEAEKAVLSLGKKYPELSVSYSPPKTVLFSRFMSYTNTTGVFCSFTMEANVNTDIPDYSIPSTMCHELSHLRGFMREDEANFIAYLACMESENHDLRYSGLMLAFIYANNALYSSDSSLGSQSFSKLSDAVRRDLSANSAYWKQFEGKTAQLAQSVNDAYLKANDLSDGTKSYGRMVDLLLAYCNSEL